MKALRCWAIAALVLAACGGKTTKDTGSVQITISGSGLGASSSQALTARGTGLTTTTPGPNSASQVAYVVLTHTGPDGGGSVRIDTVTNPTTYLFNALPVGAYTFSATAYDSAGAALFASTGVAANVYKNQVSGVALILQQIAAPGTVNVTSPLIRSIVVSDVAPATGETITFSANVVDNTDQLAYRWSASCSAELVNNGVVLQPAEGEVFSDPTASSTSFTSYCTAVETITLSVTETSTAGGGTSTVSFTLTYSAQGGSVTLTLNSWPDILTMDTPNRQPAYGATIGITSTAQDANGPADALTYAWRDTCGGSFTAGDTLTPTWTAPSRPGGTKPPVLPIPCRLTLTVTDSMGGSNSGWLAINVGEAAVQTLVRRYAIPRFAYVVNETDGTVSAYTVNVQTGALTSVGSPVATPASPQSVAVDPSNRFVYVTSYDEGVSTYSIGSDGSLTKAGDDLVLPGWGGGAVAIDPAGRLAFLYQDEAIRVFRIDPNTGALTSAGTVSASSVVHLAVDPSGRFLYAANGSMVRAFAIDAAAGTLTPITPDVEVLSQTWAVAVEPSGRFAYVTTGGGKVVTFAIDPATGGLREVGSRVDTGVNSQSVTVEPWAGSSTWVGETLSGRTGSTRPAGRSRAWVRRSRPRAPGPSGPIRRASSSMR